MATIRITATGLGDDSTALNDLIFKIYNGSTDALIHTTGSHTTDADVTVTGTTVVITNVDVGTLGAGDTVKIAATDDDGTPLTGTLSASYTITASDTTAPTFTTASFEVGNIADNIIVMPVNEALNASSVPAVGDFAVLVDAVANVVTNVDITTNSSQVRLTLTTSVVNGESVTVAYTSGVNPLEDAAGNDVANLTATAVTNNVAGSAALPASATWAFKATQALPTDLVGTNHFVTPDIGTIATHTPPTFDTDHMVFDGINNIAQLTTEISNTGAFTKIYKVEIVDKTPNSLYRTMFVDNANTNYVRINQTAPDNLAIGLGVTGYTTTSIPLTEITNNVAFLLTIQLKADGTFTAQVDNGTVHTLATGLNISTTTHKIMNHGGAIGYSNRYMACKIYGGAYGNSEFSASDITDVKAYLNS